MKTNTAFQVEVRGWGRDGRPAWNSLGEEFRYQTKARAEHAAMVARLDGVHSGYQSSFRVVEVPS